MKIVEIKQRRKQISGILFDCEINPADYGADTDAAGLPSLDSELCEIKHLKPGTELGDSEFCALVRESHIKRAKSRAMWYISRGDCSKKTMTEKLMRSFPDYAAEAAADRLEELGLINDAEYAGRRLQRIIDQKHVSVRLACHLLEAEGVDRETVGYAAQFAEYDAVAALTDLIERRYKQKLSDKAQTQNVIAALMRKGYSYSEIKEALKNFSLQTEYCED